MAVLWDLYDNVAETHDTIALGHEEFWEVSTKNGLETFSDFIQNFYDVYPQYIDDLGANLSNYKMATTRPNITGGDTVTNPPSFNWTAQGGCSYYPNNSFVLVFYNEDTEEEMFRTSPTTNCSYTLTQSEWDSVLHSDGARYYVAVAATQTSAPVTGEYISRITSVYTKPAPTIQKTLTIYYEDRYLEDVVNLIPNQSVKYTINCFIGGTKLLQTFGNEDTMMYLYDEDGVLLQSSDDEGCGTNSLITYLLSGNTQYQVEIRLYCSEDAGEIKFALTPAKEETEIGALTIEEYEDIRDYQTNDSLTLNKVLEPFYTKVLTFTPPVSGTYTFEISSSYDTYIYVIDPFSAEALVEDVDYNDDGGDGQNALLTVTLEGTIPYLIIFSSYDPSAYDEEIYISLSITKE